jgi:branched-chain amino acid transport system permease protein
VRGLQLLIGSSGQISLGHDAFFAVGAYTAGVLLSHRWLPFYVTVPAAMAVCGLFGFLFGLPATRLAGRISLWPPSHSLSRCRCF